MIRTHFTKERLTDRHQWRQVLKFAFVILMLCICVLWIIYACVLEIVTRQVTAYHRAEAESIAHMMETRVSEMKTIAVQIESDVTLARYKLRELGYDAYLAVGQLQRYKAANTFITEIVLFEPGAAHVTTSGGTGPASLFLSRYNARLLEELFADANAHAPGDPLLVHSSGAHPEYLFIFRMPAATQMKNRLIMFRVRKEQIDDLFVSSLPLRYGNLMILDAARGIRAYAYDAQTAMTPEAFAALEGTSWNGYEVLAVHGTSNPAWRYVYLVDQSTFGGELVRMRNILLSVLLTAALGTLAVSAFLSESTNREWRRLAALVHPGRRVLGDHADLVDRVNRTLAQNRQLAQSLTNNMALTRDYLITTLLTGQRVYDAENPVFEEAGIRFDAPSLFVICFRQALSAGISAIAPAQLMKIRLLVTAHAARHGDAYCVEWFDRSLMLLCDGAAPPDEIARRAAEAVVLETGVKLCVGISGRCGDVRGVSGAVYEALEAAEYAGFRRAQVCHHRQLLDRRGRVMIDAPHEQRLLVAIESGDEIDVEMAVAGVIAELSGGHFTMEAIRLKCTSIAFTLIRRRNDLGVTASASVVDYMLHSQSLDEFHIALSAVCGQLCAASREKRLEEAGFDGVVARVRRECLSPDFSIAGIADKLGISVSSLNKRFKAHAGIPPSRYVEGCRMARARELLAETDLPIKDIVLQSGYLDHASFVHKFRRLEGVTPTQYRALRRDEAKRENQA